LKTGKTGGAVPILASLRNLAQQLSASAENGREEMVARKTRDDHETSKSLARTNKDKHTRNTDMDGKDMDKRPGIPARFRSKRRRWREELRQTQNRQPRAQSNKAFSNSFL
jgi:hypothetical protein